LSAAPTGFLQTGDLVLKCVAFDWFGWLAWTRWELSKASSVHLTIHVVGGPFEACPFTASIQTIATFGINDRYACSNQGSKNKNQMHLDFKILHLYG